MEFGFLGMFQDVGSCSPKKKKLDLVWFTVCSFELLEYSYIQTCNLCNNNETLILYCLRILVS